MRDCDKSNTYLIANYFHDRNVIMKLSQYIDRKAITASKFAREINRSVSTVTRIVNGESKPDWSTMARIENATDGAVKPNDFLPTAGETAPGNELTESVETRLEGFLSRY